ncbi:MAG: hypothetical protein IJK33_09700 [Clostridia bacterium]|nr:hypothetical protein [Clostridia bacterium]
MKRFVIPAALLLLAAVCALTVLAADGTFYSVTLDSISNEYKVGDAFYVKVALCDITAPNGFLSVGIEIEYDPEMLTLQEADDGGVAEATFPESWRDAERTETVATDAEGKQAGRILLTYTAPETESGSKDNALKTDDLFVIIKFKSNASGRTAVKVDGASGFNVCIGKNENGVPESYAGKGSEIEFTFSENISGDKSEATAADEKSYTPYYIIVGSAVAIAAAVLIVSKFVRKK